MTFLNPLVLAGLVAAGIPILIHLLQLKKLRKVEFSSVRFLKEIQHASARRVKLRDYLLLILRSLAVALLVLAFARPALKGFTAGNGKTSAEIIVDDSPSTSARNEYGEISSQIRSTAVNLASSFHSGDDVGLMFTSGAMDSVPLQSVESSRALVAQISRSVPSNVSNSYTSAIIAALSKLSASNSLNKEIYLVGDLQRTEFAKLAGGINAPLTRIFFLKTEESPNDNLSVRDVKLVDPVVEVNAPSVVQATVTNNDGTDKSAVLVSLYLDGRKVSQSVVDLPAGASRGVNLAYTLTSSGYHSGYVAVDDNSIQTDNTYYFSIFAIRKLNVLIVSADSSAGDDFVSTAARALVDSSTSVELKTVKPGQFIYTDLSGIDAIVVESYAPGQDFQSKLIHYVRAGGGLALFGPSAPQLSFFRDLLSQLNTGSVSGVFSSPVGNFRSVDKIDVADQFFAGIFSSAGNVDEIKAHLVTKIFSGVNIQPNPFAHVLMSASEMPFLISRDVGSGFVFVIASEADTSASNLPLSPFFPVIMQRALFFSSAISHNPLRAFAGGRESYTYTVGGIKSASLISPVGERTDMVPQYLGGAARFTFPRLERLGTYLLAGNDTLTELSVNVDPRESDLVQASSEQILDFAKALGFSEKNVFVVDADKNAVQSIERLRRGMDLSSFFAGAALLFLVLEIVVSRMKTF